MTLTLENLQKSYGPLTVLNRCSFSFADGRIYCLMAPSGSGKTTLFRILMGLEQADGGAVRSDLPSPRFSAVFQEDRLCETFSPVENLRLVLGKSVSREDIRRELSLLLPEESLSRPVSTLSGGMKRRTAVCRAMIAPSDAVILDGRMIRRLPRKIAASTGIDALCHAIECYTSAKANPFSDLFALKALQLIFANLLPACDDPDALDAKEKMMQAAFYGGVAITCSGTTAVHALSYPLGGRYHIPHGVANAIMLMPVMRFNLPACSGRLAEVYDAVGGAGAGTAADKAAWVLAQMEAMVRHLDIPTSLAPYGVTEADLPALVAAGMEVQRLLVNNPRTVTPADAEALYRQIL